MEGIIKDDPTRATDDTRDSTYISTIVAIGHAVRTFNLLLLILCVSFFTGLGWYVYCDLADKLETDQDSFRGSSPVLSTDGPIMQKVILLTYFIFTSLSTVGLGDFHPVSNAERLAGAFILLFGVMVTSFIMENFTKMIAQISQLRTDYYE
mmetsp:Transcript_35764/g.54774  ORF Transcript_35764/g.54774 Transcript_35764/m.54774 type:complete len:151 (-) Transcript_35764:969-1421(-)